MISFLGCPSIYRRQGRAISWEATISSRFTFRRCTAHLCFLAPRRDAIDMSARGPDLELVHDTPVHGTPTWRFNGIETN